MQEITASEIREIIGDINNEIARLEKLERDIKKLQLQILDYRELEKVFYESLALKLHNFYTGCERIFQIVGSELNGGLPSSYDWHRRLLERMTTSQIGRPALLRETTAKSLQEYLGFRHVVRNVYGFELDIDKLAKLIEGYEQVWHDFQTDVNQFLDWLQKLQDSI